MQAPASSQPRLQLDFPLVQAPTSSPTTAVSLPQMQAPASFQPRLCHDLPNGKPLFFPLHYMSASNQIGKPTQPFTPTGVQIHQHRDADFSFHRFLS
jgi:hypothetical protein